MARDLDSSADLEESSSTAGVLDAPTRHYGGFRWPGQSLGKLRRANLAMSVEHWDQAGLGRLEASGRVFG